eukprot:scaffold51958_cov45-Attheya_sp.AAC.1
MHRGWCPSQQGSPCSQESTTRGRRDGMIITWCQVPHSNTTHSTIIIVRQNDDLDMSSSSSTSRL